MERCIVAFKLLLHIRLQWQQKYWRIARSYTVLRGLPSAGCQQLLTNYTRHFVIKLLTANIISRSLPQLFTAEQWLLWQRKLKLEQTSSIFEKHENQIWTKQNLFTKIQWTDTALMHSSVTCWISVVHATAAAAAVASANLLATDRDTVCVINWCSCCCAVDKRAMLTSVPACPLQTTATMWVVHMTVLQGTVVADCQTNSSVECVHAETRPAGDDVSTDSAHAGLGRLMCCCLYSPCSLRDKHHSCILTYTLI